MCKHMLWIAAMAFSFAEARADGLYTITDLGVLPGHNRSEPAAINNLGHVTGISFQIGTRNYRGFLYRDGRLIDLGTMGWEGCLAQDLNDADQVVGVCFRPDPRQNGYDVQHAFLYREGAMTDLGTSSPYWMDSSAMGLNSLGHVAGDEYDGTNHFAFLYAGGEKIHLATPLGVLTNYTALAINEAGQILVAHDGTLFVHRHGILTDLRVPGNGERVARSINARGQVAGWYETDGLPGIPPDPGEGEGFTVRHAFVYSGGGVRDLGSLGAQESVALGLNLHGQIVGGAIATNGVPGYHAVLFQDCQVYDLNNLVPTNSGWLLQMAHDLNDLGQIVCTGVSNGLRAVLLTPPFIRLSPENATNRLGQEHKLICTVTTNQAPVVGAVVEFAVTSGPNAGKPGTTATATTDAAGQASFSYVGQEKDGVDIIEARSTLGRLPILTSASKTWIGGIELNPRLILGCPGQVKELEVYDFESKSNIAADASVTYEWIGKGKLQELLLDELKKQAPQIAGKIATVEVQNGRLILTKNGVNVLQARRKTAQGEIQSNYALLISGGLELNKVTSLKIGPASLVNTPVSMASEKLTALMGAELPFSLPMILFPKEEKPCGGLLQKLGNYGFVEVKSVKFSLFGGLIEDVDLMKAVNPLVGLLAEVVTLGTFGQALSTRLLQVTAAQFLDFKDSTEARDPQKKSPFIAVTGDHSTFPYIKGMVTAKQSGLAAVQATLDLEKWCLGKATDLLWVWVLPDLDKVDIRNEQGRVARDDQHNELPIDVLVNQATQPRAVGVFKAFGEAAPFEIEWDPIGAKDSELIALAEKLLPGGEKIRERIGVPIPISYPLGASFGTNGVYEGGPTCFRFKVTYLPLEPAIRVDEFRLQTGLGDLFNTWSLKPADSPYVLLDTPTGKLTGLAPGLAELHLDVCIWGLSKGSDDAPVRVVVGEPTCVVTPPTQTLIVGETTGVSASVRVGGMPVSGVKVGFMVMSGPNAGKSVSDWSPGASFNYTGDGGPGTDTIEVTGFAWNKIFNGTATRTWLPAPVSCTLTPATSTGLVRTIHTVTARLTSNSLPAPGNAVNFVVVDGPNQGAAETVVTDDSGQARFSYAGNGGIGTDSIEANGLVGSTPFGCQATRTWTDSTVSCVVSPLLATNAVGTLHTVTASVSYNSAPAAGVAVNFAVLSGPNAGVAATIATGAHGQASFSYPGLGGPGTDTINVFGLVNGLTFEVQAVKIWADAAMKADLALSKSSNPSPVAVGQTLTYTLVVINLGPDDATGVTLTDSLPPEVDFVSASASQGCCTGTRTVTCALGGLAKGASATVTVVVNPVKAGVVSNVAGVAAREKDPNPANNSASTATSVGEADLMVAISHSPDSVYPGQNLSFHLFVQNLGPLKATGVTVANVLPPGVRLVSVTTSQGGYTGTVNWEIGVLDSGATANATLVVRPTVSGRLENSAAIQASEPDPNSANNQATDTVVIKTGPVITRITPSAAPPGIDELELKIEGNDFAPGATLSFQPGTGIQVYLPDSPDFEFMGPTELRRWIYLSPNAPPGVHEVFVTNPQDGSGGGRPLALFTVIARNQPVPRPDGLVLWLSGDGTALDVLGHNDGVLINGATADGAGLIGKAFRFDGVDDAVVVANTPELNFSGATPMTVEAWIYRTGNSPTLHILGKQAGCGGAGPQYELMLDAVDGLVFKGGTTRTWSEVDLPLNTWTHVAGTFDGSLLGIYVDGYLAAMDAGRLGSATIEPLKIGGVGACGDRFAGLIDEVSIYNRALTQGEILALASAGNAGKDKQFDPLKLVLTPTIRHESIEFSWPSNAIGFVLEETDNLSSGAVWNVVPEVPDLLANRYRISLKPPSSGSQFYRLIRP